VTISSSNYILHYGVSVQSLVLTAIYTSVSMGSKEFQTEDQQMFEVLYVHN